MSEPTIDLQRGLEVWYDFDIDYFNGQRNKVEDKSGHGRSGDVNGGPTVGVPGPAGYQATSFDGSDDYVSTQQQILEDNPYTMAILVNADSSTTNNTLMAQHREGNSGTRIRGGSDGQWAFIHYTDSGDVSVISAGPRAVSQWDLLTLTWDGSEVRFAVNGDVTEIREAASYNPRLQPLWVGGNDSANIRPISADVAFAAAWTRSLSDTEIHYLAALSAPRRVQL